MSNDTIEGLKDLTRGILNVLIFLTTGYVLVGIIGVANHYGAIPETQTILAIEGLFTIIISFLVAKRVNNSKLWKRLFGSSLFP